MSATRFVIKGRLPGLNEIIDAARDHWSKSATLKKEATELCQWAIKAASVPHIEKPVVIRFVWVEKDERRDVDNVAAGAKFVLDGLVASGRLPNDSRQWVRGISHEFPAPDKKNPRIEVEVRPW